MTNTDHFTSGRELTHGDCLHPAMTITEPDDATHYLQAYRDYIVRQWGRTPEEARVTALSNIGYFAGYFDSETSERMARLFGASHPFFASNPFEGGAS